MTITMEFVKDELEEMSNKLGLEIENEDDLYMAVMEMITTYMEL